MLIKKLTFAAVAFFFAFTGTASRGQDAGALLDLLVRKRLITDQEAEEVRTWLEHHHCMVIRKPFNLQQVAEWVSSVLERDRSTGAMDA